MNIDCIYVWFYYQFVCVFLCVCACFDLVTKCWFRIPFFLTNFVVYFRDLLTVLHL